MPVSPFQQGGQPIGAGSQGPPQVGRSAPKPFDAMGGDFDEETAKKFKAKGSAIPLSAAQKLDFGFDPADKISLMLSGTRSPDFQKQVDAGSKKGFRFVTKEVPFGDFKKVKRVFAVKKREKEEGGMRK